jgi:hypothetical protein
VHRHDADDIVRPLDHDRLEAIALGDDVGHPLERLRFGGLERKKIDALGRDDDELDEIQRVCAFSKDLPLRPTLATGGKEPGHVLEIALAATLLASVCVAGSG